jgi:hypothetical protein
MGESVGDVLAIVQTAESGRQRVFYFSRTHGVVAMLLDQKNYYVLQSPRGIGADDQARGRE